MDSSNLESSGLKLSGIAAPISSFIQAAVDYCVLIESCEQYTTDQFIHRARYQVAQIYLTALALPHIEITEDSLDRDISHEEWSKIDRSLGATFDQYNYYWHIFDPGELEPDEPVCQTLSDDLADIWRDLKPGLLHWNTTTDSQRQTIIWEWHFLFHHHWSTHAAEALRVIDWLINHHGIVDTDH